ncbi:helix-turn-helix transcriptional regulator [Anabaena sp. PCC 7108]|uniref:helix-turn-helix domain-containing protein n=1 Tax=Anabaena sp. PCC 7108 TaxID=163908 RepID=UPI00034B7AEE|nr:helix-turn-helix transcriptional regulator [Anabaena sp. PCC 7108]
MVVLEEWKEILLQEVERSTQYKVAEKLGVSPSLVSKVVKGNYDAKISKLPFLIRTKLQPELVENDEWLDRLKYICSIYKVRDVAKALNTSGSFLYTVIGDRCKSNCYKLRVKFEAVFGDEKSIESLGIRKKRKADKKKISQTDDLTIRVADAIYCGGVTSYEDLKDKFPQYKLSRSLNLLEKMRAINVIKPSLIGRGRGQLPKPKYTIACKCSSPGNNDKCANCPLGKMIISASSLLDEIDDDEV